MLDVFLGRRGMTLYTECADPLRKGIHQNCSEKKQEIDAMEKAREGASGSGWFQRRFLCQDRSMMPTMRIWRILSYTDM